MKSGSNKRGNHTALPAHHNRNNSLRRRKLSLNIKTSKKKAYHNNSYKVIKIKVQKLFFENK